MSPQDKTRIARMGAQGSAATIVAALFEGAGPEAFEQAVELHTRLTVQLFKQACANGGEIDSAPQGGAQVLPPGGNGNGAQVLPQGQPLTTPQAVAAAVPGVVVGAQVLPAGQDAAVAADVTAQAAVEQGDAPNDNIDWG
jgi:hypothetical protein